MINRFIALGALALGGAYLAKKYSSKNAEARSDSTVQDSIIVNVPVRTAYDQWTQFEEFPKFMDSVQEVKQLDNKRLHWKAEVMGKPIEWDAEITEQLPDQCIAWRSTSGKQNDGTVRFDKLSENRTRIRLEIVYVPEGPVETIGDAMGGVRLEARSNLKKFKQMIEGRGKQTGGWRGVIQDQPAGHPAT
ncbi:SRPBCC family protein [Pseudoduganella ginsengisoli]|uniref:Cyclase n=1 Tax=Pseudoduganella ginsengisoli TaxID=1462440 RepID=A0A6L6Q3Y5_9BURK|nr:SRPBCC family protein [Pseudoduganella ginsengisoli]MTW03762.1 cyclase [Pseudoduganella ginsengisoli]